MPRFSLFSSMAMFYFAAASYSEMARRLEKPHLIRRYLAADRTDFAPALKGCIERLKCGKIEDEMAFQTEVARHIAPLNIAGLALPEKRNVYGVDLEDVIRASEKLDFAPEEMRRIIAVAPWARIPLE
jgi:FADH2 O2-dependent halogenase